MSVEPQKLRNMPISILIEGRYRVLRHSIFLIGLLAILSQSSFSDAYAGIYKYYALFSVYFILVAMFYINIYVLVPFFFFKARYVLYLVLLGVVVMADTSTMEYVTETCLGAYRLLEKPQVIQGFYERMVIVISVVMVTTTVKLLQRWTKDTERIAELDNLTLRMELNELRNQINPHFLFNMLNNVKALIRTDPEKASAVIVKLSEFLRFQLYENNEDKTLLTAEMNFLSNFVALEKIRRDNLSVSIDSKTDPRRLNSVFVPPNLFTIFVENAVKHSVDITGQPTYIRVGIEIEDQYLHFTCVNSVSAAYKITDKRNSGLGLVNIKRRLELLYPDQYELTIQSADQEYTVNLIIPA